MSYEVAVLYKYYPAKQSWDKREEKYIQLCLI